MNARIRNAPTEALLDVERMARRTLDNNADSTTCNLDSLRSLLGDIQAELDLRHRSTITEQQLQTPWSRPRRG